MTMIASEPRTIIAASTLMLADAVDVLFDDLGHSDEAEPQMGFIEFGIPYDDGYRYSSPEWAEFKHPENWAEHGNGTGFTYNFDTGGYMFMATGNLLEIYVLLADVVEANPGMKVHGLKFIEF